MGVAAGISGTFNQTLRLHLSFGYGSKTCGILLKFTAFAAMGQLLSRFSLYEQ